jgi:hypothetical protein
MVNIKLRTPLLAAAFLTRLAAPNLIRLAWVLNKNPGKAYQSVFSERAGCAVACTGYRAPKIVQGFVTGGRSRKASDAVG